ncbi:DUF4158 domain-containing protein [Streptosporangium sp. NPDC087985]|uniref:DUF4158 domain-containing protein n=1 Tax=Streptosporangium sp. NPDC087985 TaxID=3366196 RepID=UPI00381FFA48
MPVEYLSAEQEARYGRFAMEPSPGKLEQFFRMDTEAVELARAKRRPATRLGWAVQWGTVRMLGTFLTEDPTAVPASVARLVAEHLCMDDEHYAEYGACSQTAYEHAWEIRDVYEYRRLNREAPRGFQEHDLQVRARAEGRPTRARRGGHRARTPLTREVVRVIGDYR